MGRTIRYYYPGPPELTFYNCKMKRFLSLALLGTATVVAHAQGKKAARKIVRSAPIVFVGHPMITGLHEDSLGRLYESTYIEVQQMLRGELLSKKVELLDTMASVTYRNRKGGGGLVQMARLGGSRSYDKSTVGVYFCQPAPAPAIPTRLHLLPDSPTQLQGYKQLQAAKIMVVDTASQQPIEGLYRTWRTEKEVWHFLAKVPRLRPYRR